MPTEHTAEQLLAHDGVRAEPAMVRYVTDRLASGATERFPILAGDARTGRPVTRFVIPSDLTAPEAGR